MYQADDPDLVTDKRVDSEGRLYLGNDYANTRVKVCIEVLETDVEFQNSER